MSPIYSVLFWIILGGICSYIAKQRNRNPVGWFFIGMFLGVLGLILLYVLPRVKEETLEPLPSSTIPENQSISPSIDVSIDERPPPSSLKPQKLWYYLDEKNKQYGPMSFDALKKVWKDDEIITSTYVWNEDMEEWKTIDKLPDILSQLRESLES